MQAAATAKLAGARKTEEAAKQEEPAEGLEKEEAGKNDEGVNKEEGPKTRLRQKSRPSVGATRNHGESVAAATSSGMQSGSFLLGCGKCRGSKTGCAQRRRPDLKGRRWQAQ